MHCAHCWFSLKHEASQIDGISILPLCHHKGLHRSSRPSSLLRLDIPLIDLSDWYPFCFPAEPRKPVYHNPSPKAQRQHSHCRWLDLTFAAFLLLSQRAVSPQPRVIACSSLKVPTISFLALQIRSCFHILVISLIGYHVTVFHLAHLYQQSLACCMIRQWHPCPPMSMLSGTQGMTATPFFFMFFHGSWLWLVPIALDLLYILFRCSLLPYFNCAFCSAYLLLHQRQETQF